MKNYNWKIKVADLLYNIWSTDNIKFEKKFLKEDLWIWKEGIKWKIFLQWLNHNEILLKIINLSFSVSYICDKCLNTYVVDYKIKNEKEVKFVNPEKIEITEEIHDILFPIDMKSQTIDIEELIEIIVKNQEPIIKNCWKHNWANKSNINKSQEDFSSYKFDFYKLLKNKK